MTTSADPLQRFKWPVSASRTIAVPASKIWEVISSPGIASSLPPLLREKPGLRVARSRLARRDPLLQRRRPRPTLQRLVRRCWLRSGDRQVRRPYVLRFVADHAGQRTKKLDRNRGLSACAPASPDRCPLVAPPRPAPPPARELPAVGRQRPRLVHYPGSAGTEKPVRSSSLVFARCTKELIGLPPRFR